MLNWNQSSFNCPSTKYIVDSTCNSGVFPNKTWQTNNTGIVILLYYFNFMNSTSLTFNGQKCSFFVRTEVCGNILGNMSKPLQVTLKGKHLDILYITGNY